MPFAATVLLAALLGAPGSAWGEETKRSQEDIASEEAVDDLQQINEGERELESPGLLVFGIVSTTGGLVCLVTAVKLASEPKAPGDDNTATKTLLIAAAMAGAIGVPTIILGSRRKPSNTGFLPTQVAVGLGTVEAQWAF